MGTYYFTTTRPIDAESNNELAESLKSTFGREFKLGFADTTADMWMDFGTIELNDDELEAVGNELAEDEYVLFNVLPTLEQCNSGVVDNMSIN